MLIVLAFPGLYQGGYRRTIPTLHESAILKRSQYMTWEGCWLLPAARLARSREDTANERIWLYITVLAGYSQRQHARCA